MKILLLLLLALSSYCAGQSSSSTGSPYYIDPNCYMATQASSIDARLMSNNFTRPVTGASTTDMMSTLTTSWGYSPATVSNYYDNSTNMCIDCDIYYYGWYYFGPDLTLPGMPCLNMPPCYTGKNYYWTSDPQPTESKPNMTTINMCASSGTSCGCDQTWSVSAVYCPNLNATIYNLENIYSFDCSTLLLADSRKPCKDGFASPTGYDPGCVQSFDFSKLDKVVVFEAANKKVDSNIASASEINFKCSFACPTGVDCSGLSGKAEFYSSADSNIIYTGSLAWDATKRRTYSYLPQSVWNNYLNTNLKCKITPSYNGLKPSFTMTSSDYFAGIMCSANADSSGTNFQPITSFTSFYSSITEGDVKGLIFKCKSTIPVTCVNQNQDCDLKLKLSIKPNSKGTSRIVLKDSCTKVLKNADVVSDSKVVSWNIVSSMETTNLQWYFDQYEMNIKIDSSVAYSNNYLSTIQFPTLNFFFYGTSRSLTKYGYAYNDPHCGTFDGKPFELQYYGEFVMYENKDLAARVHMLTYLCSSYYSPIYCVDTVYIQSIDDYVEIDRTNQVFYYRNLNVTKNPKNETKTVYWQNKVALVETNGLKLTTTDGYNYQIVTHYGTTIFIPGYLYGFTVTPSKADAGKTTGLFGNFNGDNTDDFNYLRNNVANPGGNLLAFIQSYNASAQSDIPKFSKGEFYPVTDVVLGNMASDDDENKKSKNYCLCLDLSDSNSTDYEKCNSGLTDIKRDKTAKRRRRDVIKTIDIDSLPNIPKMRSRRSVDDPLYPSGKTNITACEQIKTLTTCETNGVFTIQDFYDMCRLDYQTVPDRDWIDGYLKGITFTCVTCMTGDINLYVTNATTGEKVPQTSLLNTMCLNGCSSNGKCNDMGMCECNANYFGEDCSLNPSTLVPYIIETNYMNNTFNGTYYDKNILRVNEQLTYVNLKLTNFIINNPTGIIKAALVLVDKNGQPKKIDELQFTDYLVVSSALVNVNVTSLLNRNRNTLSSVSSYSLNVSASNDNGVSYSNPVELRVLQIPTTYSGASKLTSMNSIALIFLFLSILIDRLAF